MHAKPHESSVDPRRVTTTLFPEPEETEPERGGSPNRPTIATPRRSRLPLDGVAPTLHFLVRVVSEDGSRPRFLRRIDLLEPCPEGTDPGVFLETEALVYMTDLLERTNDRLVFSGYGVASDGLRVLFADLPDGPETEILLPLLAELDFEG